MRRVAAPALAYTLIVFAAGFVLGTLRVLVLAPRLGETGAVLLELPVMIAVSYLCARGCVLRWRVPARLAPRAVMGALAFALLMLLEFGLSTLVFGNTPRAHLARYGEALALLGLAGQLIFAAMPALLLLAPRQD